MNSWNCSDTGDDYIMGNEQKYLRYDEFHLIVADFWYFND